VRRPVQQKNRPALSCVPARWMFASGAGTAWCSAKMNRALPPAGGGIASANVGKPAYGPSTTLADIAAHDAYAGSTGRALL
jgi:hypothetical protein